MKILVVTGGSIAYPFAEKYLETHTFDRIIAADAGLFACDQLGLRPTDILGDFDSLKNLELRERYRAQGVPVREFPTRKDFTDTHLALSYAIDLWNEQPEEDRRDKNASVVILGATGTRMDHTMANIGMLAMMADHGIPCQIIDEHNEMEVLKGPAQKSYSRPEGRAFFSVLALSETAKGIDLTGFSYPLEDAEIPAFISLGVSNEIVDPSATVKIKEGYILIVQARD